MTLYEAISNEIDANTIKLLELPQHSDEAAEIRKRQSELLTVRIRLTIGEAETPVEPALHRGYACPEFGRLVGPMLGHGPSVGGTDMQNGAQQSRTTSYDRTGKPLFTVD